MTTLRLILGDQLNENHSWFQNPDPQTYYLRMETRQETDYVKHHVKKICAFFLSMRRFSEKLQKRDFQVHYLRLNDPQNFQNLEDNFNHFMTQLKCNRFEWQLPDEWRLDQQLKDFFGSRDFQGGPVDSEHFLTGRSEVEAFFEEKKIFDGKFLSGTQT